MKRRGKGDESKGRDGDQDLIDGEEESVKEIGEIKKNKMVKKTMMLKKERRGVLTNKEKLLMD